MSDENWLLRQRKGLEEGTSLQTKLGCDLVDGARARAQRQQQQPHHQWVHMAQPQQRQFLIAPLITAFLGGIGITGVAANILGFIATTAVVAGLQYFLTQKPPRPADGKVPIMQELPYCIWAVGRCRIAGAYMLREADDYGILYGVQALTAHRSSAINRFWLHDDEVELNEDNYVIGLDDDRYGDDDRVKIEYRLGAVPETPYADHVAAFSSIGWWTTNHRGDGQTSIGWLAKDSDPELQQKHFPHGPPVPTVEGDWALCWDFRDEEQDPDDEATWTWTRNPVVILCWHECFNEFGSHRDYTRAILPVIDLWKEEADVCDEAVPLAAGGTVARYTCSGWSTSEHDPRGGTNAILATFDGWTCERGDGALLVVAGKYREEYCGIITDADIAGVAEDFDVLFADEVNQVIPKFNFPETGYVEAVTDGWKNTDAQLTAGRSLPEEADYRFVTEWTQAQRLGKRDFLRWQQKKRGTLDIRLSGINAAYRRWNKVVSTFYLPELNNKVVEFRRTLISLMRGGFQSQFIEFPHDTIEDWNPATDEGAKPPVPGTAALAPGDVPLITNLESVELGNSVILKITIIEPTITGLVPVSHYRVHEAGAEWSPIQQHNDAVVDDGEIILRTNTVPDGQELEVQVAFRRSGGSLSDWSPSELITPVITPKVSQPVENVHAAVTGGDDIEVTWDAPSDEEDFDGARVYLNTANSFDTATPMNPPVYADGSPSYAKTILNQAPGSYYVWVVAFANSGQEAAAVAASENPVTII